MPIACHSVEIYFPVRRSSFWLTEKGELGDYVFKSPHPLSRNGDLSSSSISGCNRPQATGIESDEIDTSGDPLQISVPSQEPIVIKVKKGEFKLTPVADYKIAALVVGKETYSYGWNAKISPVDLALAWGKLADPEFRKYVSYSVGNRWVSFRVKEGKSLRCRLCDQPCQ